MLENIDVLVRMRYGLDERLRGAVKYISSQQDEQGRWKPRTLLRNRMWINIEKRGKLGKWVTLRALRIF